MVDSQIYGWRIHLRRVPWDLGCDIAAPSQGVCACLVDLPDLNGKRPTNTDGWPLPRRAPEVSKTNTQHFFRTLKEKGKTTKGIVIMKKKHKNSKPPIDAPGVATENEALHDLLGDFSSDQMVALVNQLLESKVLPLAHVMHVVRSFAYAAKLSASMQSLDRDDLDAMLIWTATETIHDYCATGHHAQ